MSQTVHLQGDHYSSGPGNIEEEVDERLLKPGDQDICYEIVSSRHGRNDVPMKFQHCCLKKTCIVTTIVGVSAIKTLF